MKVSCVISLSHCRQAQGRALADRFALPFVDGAALEGAKSRDLQSFVRSQLEVGFVEPRFVFLFKVDGLSLVQISNDQWLSIKADFYGATVNYRRQKGGGKGEMIAKAIGLGSGVVTTVLDATTGLGGDAFVLASLGASLTMLERVPEVRALVEDGLRMAVEWGATNDASLVEIIGRMQLIEVDANNYLHGLKGAQNLPDVVYLDPMFPVRTKSAQVKKEMRVFHQLVGTDPDADALLEAALACARKRVVVKRPRVAPTLAGAKPSYSLEGKSNRYDVYTVTGSSFGIASGIAPPVA
jgi:16S rRNA (guanine1516-N2)-methyltransferase